MALHKIDKRDEAGHTRDASCPCGPVRTEGNATFRIVRSRQRFPYRGVIYTHQPLPAPVPDERLAGDVTGLPEADCGCTVVDVDGNLQHHAIPDDEAQHAPTVECGCGPQAEGDGRHRVFVHVDQGFSEETEQLYREVFGTG